MTPGIGEISLLSTKIIYRKSLHHYKDSSATQLGTAASQLTMQCKEMLRIQNSLGHQNDQEYCRNTARHDSNVLLEQCMHSYHYEFSLVIALPHITLARYSTVVTA